MCKGYSWMVQYVKFDTAGKCSPIPNKRYGTLAEARAAIRGRGRMDRRPEVSGVIAEAIPVSDVPPMRMVRGVHVHCFCWTGRDVREFVW